MIWLLVLAAYHAKQFCDDVYCLYDPDSAEPEYHRYLVIQMVGSFVTAAAFVTLAFS